MIVRLNSQRLQISSPLRRFDGLALALICMSPVAASWTHVPTKVPLKVPQKSDTRLNATLESNPLGCLIFLQFEISG